MKLAIRHHSRHATDAEGASLLYVRLSPRDDPVQRTTRWRLTAPNTAIRAWRDGFGNVVHTVATDPGRAALALDVEGEIDTAETWGIVPLAAGGPPPETFLRLTPRTEPNALALDLCARFDSERKRGALRCLHALLTGSHEAAVSALGQPPSDCAHLFISCCRIWRIPARYVSGYLHDGTEDGGASVLHAWAEALVEDLGWVSFDPSYCRSATHAYVRLAVALDADGAKPVRGASGGDACTGVTSQQ